MKNILIGFTLMGVLFGVSPVSAVEQCQCVVQYNVGRHYCEVRRSFEIGNTASQNIAGIIGWIITEGEACVPEPRDTLFQQNDLDVLYQKLTEPIASTPLSNQALCDSLCSMGNSCENRGEWRTRVRCEYVDSEDVAQAAVSVINNTQPPAVIETQLINPLTGTTEAQGVPELVGGIIQRALGILGSLALVVFMYGAFKWITSGGEAENITAGTHTMAYAAIGILVIFASYGILSSVIGGILGQ